MKVTDFSNTWCKATKKNYKQSLNELRKNLGFHNVKSFNVDDLENYIWIVDKDLHTDKIQASRAILECIYIFYKDYDEIRLVDGEFHYVEKEMTELDKTKEKFESGNYIWLCKNINTNWKVFNYKNDGVIPKVTNHKLIHKKHEDILNAYLKNNNVEIEVYERMDNDYGLMNVDFIKTYEERCLYRLKTEKEELEENSFNKFGFETPDFEGEILKEVEGCLIGWHRHKGSIISCSWNTKGICYSTMNYKDDYNLTPLKVNWWEKDENFPCLMVRLKDGIKKFGVFKNKNHVLALHPKDGWRLATKEEILTLLVEE